jgi:hypothetical protein
MKPRHITILILIVVTLLLIAWDVYAYLAAGSQATISRVVLDWAGHHPVLPFLIGVVAGHLLWPQRLRR